MLTPPEVAALAPRAAKLAEELREALSPASEGGKTITKAEGRRIINLALGLIAALVLEILD